MARWYTSLESWVKSLLSETFPRVWIVLSGFSTLSTFFLRTWSEKPLRVSLLSLVLGFFWATFRVFRHQQTLIAELRQAQSQEYTRIAELRITADGGRYVLIPVAPNVRVGDFQAIFVEFRLMIENLGQKNSTVKDFDVQIMELANMFSNLKPVEGKRQVQGRHCLHGLDINNILSKTGMVRIPPEDTTNFGTLVFIVDGVNLQMFVDSGLSMSGPERKFPPLHFRLTLTDTNNFSATAEFILGEA